MAINITSLIRKENLLKYFLEILQSIDSIKRKQIDSATKEFIIEDYCSKMQYWIYYFKEDLDKLELGTAFEKIYINLTKENIRRDGWDEEEFKKFYEGVVIPNFHQLNLKDLSRNDDFYFQKLISLMISMDNSSNFRNTENNRMHPAKHGQNFEKTLITLLESSIPAKFKIENSKFLIDCQGNFSRECDIIIWNRNGLPRIQSQISNSLEEVFNLNTISVEIECTTTLTMKKISDDWEKIKVLRNMDYNQWFDRLYPEGNTFDYPATILVAYDCDFFDKFEIPKGIIEICKKKAFKPYERFDLIYVIKRGIFIGWKGKNPEDKKKFNVNRNSLGAFLNLDFPKDLKENQRKLTPVIYQVNNENFNTRIVDKLLLEKQIYGYVLFTSLLNKFLEKIKLKPANKIVEHSINNKGNTLSGSSSNDDKDFI